MLTLSCLTLSSKSSTLTAVSGFCSLSSSGVAQSSQEVMSCRSEVSCWGSLELHCSLLTAWACSSSQRSITPAENMFMKWKKDLNVHLSILIWSTVDKWRDGLVDIHPPISTDPSLHLSTLSTHFQTLYPCIYRSTHLPIQPFLQFSINWPLTHSSIYTQPSFHPSINLTIHPPPTPSFVQPPIYSSIFQTIFSISLSTNSVICLSNRVQLSINSSSNLFFHLSTPSIHNYLSIHPLFHLSTHPFISLTNILPIHIFT